MRERRAQAQPTDDSCDKRREARARREARRQGYAILKSRSHTMRERYGGRYWIVDPYVNGMVAGDSNVGMSLADVEVWLAAREPVPGRREHVS